MNGQKELYELFHLLNISFEYYEHPPAPTIKEAEKYWKDIDAYHSKNLFFRNHKGDKHYLVLLNYRHSLNIHDIEKRLKQGKLSFASESRINKYLRLRSGSISPFGIINDANKHVYLFIDDRIKQTKQVSFHPNINTASVVISYENFLKFLNFQKNTFEFIGM
jgi:Ala-tRNA(Pro) deacylase